MKNILEIQKLTKTYGNIRVFDKYNLKITPNNLYLITGISGVGKTTLLNIMAGLDKNFEGRVVIAKTIRLAYVLQDFGLWPHLNTFWNLALAMILDRPLDFWRIKIEINDLSKQLNIKSVLRSYPNKLSGGQKQRVAILRSLLTKPDLLLLDEPTSSLDDDNTAVLVRLLQEFVSHGKTIILVTHDNRLLGIEGAKTIKID